MVNTEQTLRFSGPIKKRDKSLYSSLIEENY